MDATDITSLNSNMLQQVQNTANTQTQGKQDLQKIKKACRDFEAIFTYYVLKTMRQTIPKNSGAGSLAGKETYNMIMDQKIAEDLSKKGDGLGLQKVLYQQLTKSYPKEDMQEVQLDEFK